MNKLIRIPGRKYNRFAILMHQKSLIEQHFPFLHCNIINKVLVCTGIINMEEASEPYKVKIEYVAGLEPKTTIILPIINPTKDIHMYNDHSLCLYYPPDMKWNHKTKIYQYTIPWISEWIIFYERYKVNGNIWEGKESPVHITERDKNINRNIE